MLVHQQKATAVSGAPTNCQGVVVTNERHVVALGAGGDPRKVQWSSRETLTTWTPSTNTAGDIQIPTGGRILAGANGKLMSLSLLIQELLTLLHRFSFYIWYSRCWY